jgi:hypothetical protein
MTKQPGDAERSIAESLLDVHDQLLGMQAQLDELHERLESVERLAGRRNARWRRVAARARPRRRAGG